MSRSSTVVRVLVGKLDEDRIPIAITAVLVIWVVQVLLVYSNLSTEPDSTSDGAFLFWLVACLVGGTAIVSLLLDRYWPFGIAVGAPVGFLFATVPDVFQLLIVLVCTATGAILGRQLARRFQRVVTPRGLDWG